MAHDSLVRIQRPPVYKSRLASRYRLGSDKFSLKTWFAIFQKHPDHLFKIALQFIKRCALGMGTGKTRNVTNIKLGLVATFNDSRKLLMQIA